MRSRNQPSSLLRYVLAWCLALSVFQVYADAESDYQRGATAYGQDDLIGAMQYLESAAQQGHAEAMLLLGYIFDKAEENETAAAYYQRAAEAGSLGGAHAMGTMYASGDGVAQDLEKARSWYQRAADGGHGPALETLGIAYLEGTLGLEQNSERGLELLRLAAANGQESAGQLIERIENKKLKSD